MGWWAGEVRKEVGDFWGDGGDVDGETFLVDEGEEVGRDTKGR